MVSQSVLRKPCQHPANHIPVTQRCSAPLLDPQRPRQGISPAPQALCPDVEITLRYFEGCPNWQTARDRLREAIELAGLGGGAKILFELVATEDEARAASLPRFPDNPDRRGRSIR